ncbi:MAG TPA: NAD(P)H:quinone oxidoreductase [Burkholderiales bacterium]|nr:NAD(P)H:quinone oxidoreductase [Burkholderiales bacterium]
MTNKEILVLFYTTTGATKQLAQLIARGIESVSGMSARLRTVPKVSTVCEQTAPEIPDSGVPYVSLQDLNECVGLALGSPVRFGNMAASMKYFWDSTSGEWLSGALIGKPACVFTSSGSMHGGQESCLISMMLPLLHHGMCIVGLPYSNAELLTTRSGGTPYGVSHLAGSNADLEISKEEKALALAQGKHLAQIASKLS